MSLICVEFHQTPIRLSKTTNLVCFNALNLREMALYCNALMSLNFSRSC